MAKKGTEYTFKEIEISLEEGTVTEFTKDAILTHDLWEILKELEANGRQDLSIKSHKVINGTQE